MANTALNDGKGAVTAHLVKTEPRVVIGVRVGGPNAGHTVVDSEGRAFALRQVPVAAVVRPGAWLVIAGGSEINPDVLRKEIDLLEGNGYPVRNRLFIDSEATVLEPRHIEMEAELLAEGHSTRKGIGTARASRAIRNARLWRTESEKQGHPYRMADTAAMLNQHLRDGDCVVIEGTQGYGLGTHAGGYPDVTSGDCRAIDFLAQAGISPWAPWIDEFEVWVCLRTYPIRIAGDSGPLKDETTWEEIGVEPEFTTVTKKMRRVGGWDQALAKAAIEANGGSAVKVAYTFADYVWPEWAGKTAETIGFTTEIHDLHDLEEQLGAGIQLVGTGPASVIDVREWEG